MRFARFPQRRCLAIALGAILIGACGGQSESPPNGVNDAGTGSSSGSASGSTSSGSSSSSSSSGGSSSGEEDAATVYDAALAAEVPSCFAARELTGSANLEACTVCAIQYCRAEESPVASECPAFLQCLCPPAPPPQPGQCEPELQGACVNAVNDFNRCIFNSPCALACGSDAGY